ncbi:hypothetical protein RRF57_011743 [Xylaria bambusicola]|uniref:Uncharacterized protein n=1 Tax=Xylaria bambusicola TaxID=326684 RepID=A0AAN7V0Y7_9PEZI
MDDLVNSKINWEKAVKIYETATDPDEEILGTICANVGKHGAVTGDFEAADKLEAGVPGHILTGHFSHPPLLLN